MTVGVVPGAKVVDAPSWGCVVRVPATMSEREIAVGLIEGSDHETTGSELNDAEDTAAEPETTAEPVATAELAAAGADDAWLWRAKTCLSWTLWAETAATGSATAPRTASFMGAVCWIYW